MTEWETMEAAAQRFSRDFPPPSLVVDLSRAAGMDLGVYRRQHVAEQVRAALGREHVADERALARLVRTRPAARERFRRSLAGGGNPLRVRRQLDLLERELLSDLLADGRLLTVWSAACGDGSALHDLAVLLDRHGALGRSLLLGTDLLDENVAAARTGGPSDASVAPPSLGRIRWERWDVVRDGAPRGGWRVVLAGDLLRHLASAPRRRVLRTLAGSLAPGGLLFLDRAGRADAPRLGLERVCGQVYRREAA
jgi:chemotaxis protein methyltransferase CheR